MEWEDTVTETITVDYDGKSDTVRFVRGQDPTAWIHNRMMELHTLCLAMWLFYSFGVALGAVLTASLTTSFGGLVALPALLGLTVYPVLKKNKQLNGLIKSWDDKLAGKPTPPKERLGPPLEWL